MNLRATMVLIAALGLLVWLDRGRPTSCVGLLCALPSGQAGQAGGATPAAPKVAAPSTNLLERGRSIAGQAFGLLSSNLTEAIARGGISNALAYCSVKALPLTALVAETNRVNLRRVTHKARNPADRADAAELKILDQYRNDLAAGRRPLAPLLTTNTTGVVTFYAPIVITNPLCLLCHGKPGTDIAPAHLEVIRRLYPEDEAVGFKLGDLRGLWRVEFRP